MCHCGNTGVERTPNKSQRTKLTLEKKILPPPLPGFELAAFRSRVRRSNQQANGSILELCMSMGRLHLQKCPNRAQDSAFTLGRTGVVSQIVSHLETLPRGTFLLPITSPGGFILPPNIFPGGCYVLASVCMSENAPYHHHHQFLNREGRWGTTDDFATSFLHFPCSPLPSGTCRTPGLSILVYGGRRGPC